MSDAEATAAVAAVDAARALSVERRWDEALERYEQVIERYGARREPGLADAAWKARANRVIALRNLGRREEALTACEALLARARMAEPGVTAGRVARIALARAGALEALGRAPEALAAADDMLERCDQAPQDEVADLAAWGLSTKARALQALGRSDDAVSVRETLVERFAGAHDPAVRDLVERALKADADVFRDQGRREDAVRALWRLVRLTESAANEFVDVGSRLELAEWLVDLGRRAEADEALSALPEDYGQPESAEDRRTVANVMLRHAQLANPASGVRLRLIDALVARFSAADDPELREVSARALFARARIMKSRGREAEAIRGWQEIEALAGDPPLTQELNDLAARALTAAANTLQRHAPRDRSTLGPAVAAWEQALHRLRASRDSELQARWIPAAMVGRGLALARRGRSKAAAHEFDAVIREYAESDRSETQTAVAVARHLRSTGQRYARERRNEGRALAVVCALGLAVLFRSAPSRRTTEAVSTVAVPTLCWTVAASVRRIRRTTRRYGLAVALQQELAPRVVARDAAALVIVAALTRRPGS